MLRHRRDRVVADAVAHRVEIGVAALGDGAAHVDRAVAAEAAEEAVAERVAAAGSGSVSSGSIPCAEQRQRAHRLDRRARRVERVQRLVEQRAGARRRTASAIRSGRCRRRSCWGRRPASRPGASRSPVRQSRTTQPSPIPRPAGARHSPAGRRRCVELDGAAAAVGLGRQLADQLAARGELDALPAGRAAQPRSRASSRALPCRS